MPKFCTKEVLYVLAVAFGPLNFGFIMGMTSPALTEWQGGKTTNYQQWDVFHGITTTQYTWFNAITSLFACLGPFIVEWLDLLVSLKVVFFLFSLAAGILWVCHLFISEELFYYGILIRALIGLAVGGIATVSPILMVEIAPPGLSGYFGNFNQCAIVIGIVWMNIQGNYYGWKTLVGTGIACSICGMIFIWFCPSTYIPPMKIADSSEDYEEDSQMDPYEKYYCEEVCTLKEEVYDVTQWKYLSKVLISMMIMFFQQFAGINALITDLDKNFVDVGIALDPGLSSALTSGAQLISCIIFGFLIDIGWRKQLYIISIMGCGIMLIFTAFNSWWNIAKWLPIVLIFLYMFFFCISLGPYPWYIVIEQLPDHRMRVVGQARVANCNWFFSFMIIFLNPAFVSFLGQEWTQILYSGFSILGAIYAYFYLTEPERPKPCNCKCGL